MELLNINNVELFRENYRNWIDAALEQGNKNRERQWTESIAVGSKVFVEKMKDDLGYKAIGRKIIEKDESFSQVQ